MSWRPLTLLAIFMLALPTLASARRVGPSPTAVVHACYRWHFTHDMRFTPRSVREKAPWLAPDLALACLTYLTTPAKDDEAPSIDGDPFTDSQDYPSSFRAGRAVIDGATARVPVTLAWPDQSRDVDVALTLVEGRWLITDVRYGDAGSLRGLLRSAP